MNLRDLINRIESIELNEGLRLKDIEAQVGQEKDEQKRAQILMTLAQNNKLPGLYDPVSGYFVSADPEMDRSDSGTGQSKPRISATGTESSDALLAKRGLVPPKANTSTFLRHLNPFSSSNKDYDAGVQGGSQAAIARQTKEDDELKQLTDLIPKYKALKDKLASLSTAKTDAPADKPLKESLMESFSDLFEAGLRLPGPLGAAQSAGEMLPNVMKKFGSNADDWSKIPGWGSRVGMPKPRPDIDDAAWRAVPDNMKSGVGAWLKDNPKKSIAAALAAVAAAGSQIGGGQGQRNGPTADQMATANGATTAPSAGSTPSAVNPSADAKTSEPTTYQIKPGDNLSTIAKRNNVSVAELMAANPSITNPNKITAGATITIPSASGKPTYDQGVGSKPVEQPSIAKPRPDDTPADDAKAAEDTKKKAEIEATQKEIDAMKAQLAALIIDLEKSEDEDNIRQLKDLESQLDDLDDIKALNATNPNASNYTNQMDQASDAASSKPAEAPKLTAKDATTPVADTDYSVASAPNAKNAKLNAMKESDELDRWLRIANIK
jgi:LysM repeat protein